MLTTPVTCNVCTQLIDTAYCEALEPSINHRVSSGAALRPAQELVSWHMHAAPFCLGILTALAVLSALSALRPHGHCGSAQLDRVPIGRSLSSVAGAMCASMSNLGWESDLIDANL